MRVSLWSLLAFVTMSVLLLTSCSENQDTENNQPPPPSVKVSKPLIKSVLEWDEYTGRFDAVERVNISARVSGYLDEIRFVDGDYVNEGDILFVIDQRPFEIELNRAKAQYLLAEKELNRAKKLREAKAIAEEELERRIQEYTLTKVAVDEAELDLEFSEVKSPISGRISEANVDIGNQINGGENAPTTLTTVVSTDPIHFYFQGSESDLLKYIRLDRKGERPGSDETANPIFVKLADEDEFVHRGSMDFVDNEVDRGTGTIEGRAIFPNPDGIIYPGMFGRARLVGAILEDSLLIPESAILTDQTKKMVMILGENNIVEPRFIELGPLRRSGLRVVKSGLTPDDVVIIDGLMKAWPGAPVTPTEERIKEDDNPEDFILSPSQKRPEHQDQEKKTGRIMHDHSDENAGQQAPTEQDN